MNIDGFLWLEPIIEKLWRKHNVSQNEVEDVFDEEPYFRFVENGLRAAEHVYAALGQTRDRRAFIVSARDMTSAERELYGQR